MSDNRQDILVVDGIANQLTYQIIGASKAVHNTLWSGLIEEVYEKVLEVELNRRLGGTIV